MPKNIVQMNNRYIQDEHQRYCMVRLQGAEEEQAQYRKRAKNTVLFYIVAESIWQIKDIVMYYYG